MLVHDIVVGVSDQRPVVRVEEQLDGHGLELLPSTVTDVVQVAVRIGGADHRSVGGPLRVEDSGMAVAIVLDDVFVLEEANFGRDVPDADEAVVCGRQNDVVGDRVRLDDKDVVLVTVKR